MDGNQKRKPQVRGSGLISLLCALSLALIFLSAFQQTANEDNVDASPEDTYVLSRDGTIFKAATSSTSTVEFSSQDAAETVRAAIDALPASGGTIHFAEGNFKVFSPIVINKPCFIEGEGSGRSHPDEGVTQISFGNQTGLTITSAGVRISHLQLRGCGETFTGCYGILLDASSECLNQNIDIEDVMIADTYYAIYGTGTQDIWDLRLSDVYINYCYQGIRIDKTAGAVQLQTSHVVISHARGDAVFLTCVDAVILDSIYFIEPGGNGIVIASFVSYPLMIRNCQIDECHENGIVLAFDNASSLWLTVTDTQIKARKSAIYLFNSQDVIMSNCHIAASQLSLSNESIVHVEDSYRIQMNNCLIKNLSNQTRNCVELHDSHYCQVTGCHIDHSVGLAENIDYTIKETGTQSNCNQIINNICVGASKAPAYVYGGASTNQNNI